MNVQILRTESLSKRFGSVTANDGISIDVQTGEILCLFGENGAGKSTLSSCLTGFLAPDSGKIIYKGDAVRFSSAADAIRIGIGMVHQHFVLIEEFTVLENIIVGAQPGGVLLQKDAAELRLRELCGTYGIELDFHALVRDLSVGEQQWVELLKALFLGADLLILDEPTATLGPEDSKRLFKIIEKIRGEGLSIILISHKLEEVMQSDRVSVLRKGQLVGTVVTSQTTPHELTRMMVGRDVALTTARDAAEQGDVRLELLDVSVAGRHDLPALENISFTVRSHEILGIAGVAGNGQNELMEVIAGLRQVQSGQIMLDGRTISGRAVKDIMSVGVGHIPDDRFREGLVPGFSIAENLILGNQRSADFCTGPFLDRSSIDRFAGEKMTGFQIDAPSGKTPVGNLSGGNAQRVILAREMKQAKRLLLANQPTRGLDVGAIEYVYQQLLEQRREGNAILFASAELEDLFQICDRIAVLFKGRLMGIVDPAKTDVQEIGLMMAGQASSNIRVDGVPLS
jgi:simple sugar transport system ATP-binding protein